MINLKDRINKFFSVSLAALTLAGTALTVVPEVSNGGITANAASISERENNDTLATANNISIGDSVNGSISEKDDADYYQITLSSSGTLNVSFNAYMSWVYLYIYDISGNEIVKKNVYWNSTTQKITGDYDFDLTKGTYYVCFGRDGSNTGNYDFNTNFTSSDESFTETEYGSNNTLAQASKIDAGKQYNGQLAENDDKDFYKINLTSSGRINFTFSAYMSWIYLYIYDVNGNEIFKRNISWNSTTQKITGDYDFDLTKGTYYVCFGRDGSNTGNYDFKTTFTSSKETFAEVDSGSDNTLANANSISLGTQYKGQIALTDDRDFYRFIINSSGKVKLSISAYMSWIYLYIYDVNGNEIFRENISWNSTTHKITGDYDFDFTKGTYYVCFGRDGDNTGNYEFSVSSDVAVTGIKLNKTSLSLEKGETATISATITPSNATDKKVTWTTSNSSVASVNNGRITAKSVGTARITAKTSNGKEASCTVTVKNPVINPTGIRLSKTSINLTKGSTTTITATVNPIDATNKSVTWTTSNSRVATVSNGKITAKSAGTATITAKTSNGKKATCKVTVKNPTVNATSVKLSKTSVSLVKGKTTTIKATVTPSNATNKKVTWTTSNSKVATVSNGKITAKSAGTATITAKTSNGKKATCKVTVKNVTVNAKSVKLSKTSVTLGKGKSTTIKATVSPSNTTNKKITWTTSNKKVATVSNGKITAKGVGTATITAKTANGKKATCKVTVRNLPTKVKLNRTSASLKKGKTVTLKATVTPGKNVISTVTWSTSNSRVATVKNGKVTAKAKGTATITVKTTNGKTARCKITVK